MARWLLAALLLAACATAQARGPWRASEANTRGWQFMTPDERVAHQARVRGFTRLEDCRAYQQEHHRLMVERARAQGAALPGGGRDICAHLEPGSEAPR